jgi:hypothetical protein
MHFEERRFPGAIWPGEHDDDRSAVEVGEQ